MKRSVKPQFNTDLIFWLFFISALIAGFYLRNLDLHLLPCGVSPDEAYNIMDASSKGLRVAYPNPHAEVEGFFISLIGLIEMLMGSSDRTAFIASMLLGLWTVAIWGLAVRKHFGNELGLLTTIMLAFSPWHLAISHSGTRIITAPFFVSLFFLALPTFGSSLYSKASVVFTLGMAYGLGFYGYLNYRVTLLILFAVVISMYFQRRYSSGKKVFSKVKLRNLFYFFLGLTIVVLPLLLFYKNNPKVVYTRILEVNILSLDLFSNLNIIVNNFSKQLSALFIRGSINWHHSLANQPYLQIYLLPGFILGLIYSARSYLRYLKGEHSQNFVKFIFPSFLIMLLPDLITDSPGNGGRLSVGLPLIYLITALGIYQFIYSKLRINKVFTIYFVFTAFLLFIIGLLHSFALLSSRQKNLNYAKSYFCDAPLVSKYLNSDYFLSSLPDNKKTTIYIIGSWFDFVPYRYYIGQSYFTLFLKGRTSMSVEEALDKKYKLRTADLVVIPTFSTINYLRISNHFDKINALKYRTVKETILSNYPRLKLILVKKSKNQNWFPKGVVFEIYRYQ